MNLDIKSPIQKNTAFGGKSLAFVEYIIRRSQSDSGVRAALKRADNPSTEYQSWDVLAGFKVDLESESERLSHGIVAAAIARTESTRNGSVRIGHAIARCYEDGNKNDQAKAKLRRLLACDSLSEAFRILRPLLRLIESRGAGPLDYAALLNGLEWFNHDDSRNRTKARWAQEFYGGPIEGGRK